MRHGLKRHSLAASTPPTFSSPYHQSPHPSLPLLLSIPRAISIPGESTVYRLVHLVVVHILLDIFVRSFLVYYHRRRRHGCPVIDYGSCVVAHWLSTYCRRVQCRLLCGFVSCPYAIIFFHRLMCFSHSSGSFARHEYSPNLPPRQAIQHMYLLKPDGIRSPISSMHRATHRSAER